MVDLIELCEENWMDFAGLSVDESQKAFLASNIGIIARGYVYRNSRAKVIGIVSDGIPVGLAMVRDMEDEPVCYELQQFMIDKNFQCKGYGLKALERILAALKAEQKYDSVEVCVKREDAQAIHKRKRISAVFCGLSCGKTDRFSLSERDRKRNRRTLRDGRIKRLSQKRRGEKTVRAGKESGRKSRIFVYAS